MRLCGKYLRLGGWTACLVAIVAFTTAGCGGENVETGRIASGLLLTAQPQELQLAPGAQGSIEFRLTDKDGRNRTADTLRFSLVAADQAPGGARDIAGATLVTAEGSTNNQGRFVLELKAGAVGRFRVRASYGNAPDKFVPITVSRTAIGRAAVTIAPGKNTVPVSVELRLYRAIDCGQVSISSSPPSNETDIHRMAAASTWELPELSNAVNHAVTARGVDQNGSVMSFGCSPINGSQLRQTSVSTFVVPLFPIAVSLAPKFEAASELTFPGEPAAAAVSLASSWASLSRCSYGPTQKWLDCTLDALGPAGIATPLDCVPEVDEGDVGRLLAARRGVILPDADDCRGAVDPGGQPSADAQIFALFPKNLTGPLAALPSLSRGAQGLFSRLRISSSLDFSPSGKPGTWISTHTIRSIGFPVGEAFVSVPLSERPGRTSRFIIASLNEAQSQLSIAPHRFALNVGEAAHLAFRTKLLGNQGLPTEELAFLNQLASQAVLPAAPASISGCAAMDTLLCPQIGKPVGCLESACRRGLGALAQNVTAGFDELSSDELALQLSGTAPLADRSTDGFVGALGSLVINRGGPGLWLGELRGASTTNMVTGLWVATRQAGQ
jgi:hypothetical protein